MDGISDLAWFTIWFWAISLVFLVVALLIGGWRLFWQCLAAALLLYLALYLVNFWERESKDEEKNPFSELMFVQKKDTVPKKDLLKGPNKRDLKESDDSPFVMMTEDRLSQLLEAALKVGEAEGIMSSDSSWATWLNGNNWKIWEIEKKGVLSNNPQELKKTIFEMMEVVTSGTRDRLEWSKKRVDSLDKSIRAMLLDEMTHNSDIQIMPLEK